MLESLLFIALLILGGITLILSIVCIVIGLNKKEKSLRNIGFGIGIIPVFCFGIVTFWYGIAIPSFYNKQMNTFAGTYLPTELTKNILTKNNKLDKPLKLKLNPDGTYEFDIIQGVGLKKKGTWETGGIDGCFNFYDESGKLIDFGMPAGNEDNCSISFEFRANENNFFEVESISFKKSK